MIRVIQRRLIIPRGDTGVFTIPAMTQAEGAIGVFTIFDPITNTRIFQKQVEIEGENFNISFSHADTVNLQAGNYLWDIKFYKNPILADNKVIDGEEINSYYAAFQAPKCEIRETGDDFLMIEGQPAKIEDLNIILAATEAANAAKVAATEQAGIATAKAEEAATKLEEMMAAIPTKVSDLTDDSGHYTKPANGIPAADLADGVVPVQDVTINGISTLNNNIANIPKAGQNTLGVVSVYGSGLSIDETGKLKIEAATVSQIKGGTNLTKPIVPATQKTSIFYGLAELSGDTTQSYSDNAVGTYTSEAKAAIQQMLDVPSTADIPTNVSELTNDAGYLTEHQDISGKANVADLATIATSGSYEDLEDKPTIPDVQINGNSIIENGVANIPLTASGTAGVVKSNATFGIGSRAGTLIINSAPSSSIKEGTAIYLPITPEHQHESTFYGLAKAAGDTTQRNSDNTVGTYTDGAKTAIQNMLDVPSNAAMNTAIGTAIGNINSFDMAVVQELPTQDINTHTIYLVPKTGETNDVYDEYVYINSAWEMVGNTQIDLSNYVQKTDYATSSQAGISKVNNANGIDTYDNTLIISPATKSMIMVGTDRYHPIVPYRLHTATFYGLAKAAGDTTQSQSSNAVGTYTNEAKAAIQQMLDVPSTSDIPDVSIYATKADTVLDTTLSSGRKEGTTIGGRSFAFGNKVEASGNASFGIGNNTIASGIYSHAEGGYNQALGAFSHAEGGSMALNGANTAKGFASHAEGGMTIASGQNSHTEGTGTRAVGRSSHAEGKFNVEDNYFTWNEWVANTEYSIGDKVKVTATENEATVVKGYICKTANNDSEFTPANWNQDLYMNFVEIIGNGTADNARSNAYALDWDGNGHYAGDVYVGANADSTGGTKVLCEADFATAQDIQNIINGGAGA